jgi:TolB protein
MTILSQRICLSLVLLGVSSGCAEYNRHETHSEADSLTGTLQLTSDFPRVGEAHFSPDMRWIIFSAVPNGERQLAMYLVKVRSKVNYEDSQNSPVQVRDIIGIERPIRISPPGSTNGSGAFSSDGLSLIFSSTAGKETNSDKGFPPGEEIFRVDGWEGAAAMSDPAKGLNFAQHPLTDNDAYDGECSYSPDGKWICFTSNRDGDLNLYAMHVDGSHVVRLTHSPGYDGGANFSPNGKQLVYRSDRNGDRLLQIFVSDLVFNSSGEITGIANEKPLTHEQNVNWGPFWHPDGEHIIYSTNHVGPDNEELYLMRRDGTLKTRITFNPGPDVVPVFSPDGRYLMWISKRADDHTMQVFVAKFQFPEGS